MKKKKLTQVKVSQLRILLREVTKKQQDPAPLPRDYFTVRLLAPILAVLVAHFYLEKTSFFIFLEPIFEQFFDIGVTEGFEILFELRVYFLLWGLAFLGVIAVFYWRRYSFRLEMKALLKRATNELDLWKKDPKDKLRIKIENLQEFLRELRLEYDMEDL